VRGSPSESIGNLEEAFLFLARDWLQAMRQGDCCVLCSGVNGQTVAQCAEKGSQRKTTTAKYIIESIRVRLQ
jgi:hypothetical protein